MSDTAQTPDESRIAERYLSVLADVSGCAQAVRDGAWHHLADVADELGRRAGLLAEAAGKLDHPETEPRAEVVVNLVAARNSTSQAARLLHPVGSSTMPTTRMTDPFTHPDAQPNAGR